MLNLKNPEVRELAQTLARRTGQTLTGAVLNSLRDSVARLPPDQDRKIDMDAVRALIEQSSKLMRAGPRFEIEDLYDDETGLPK
ncbi:MAG: type II toxin-antitoxin system VapB family antitoxin [Tagaea sp.]|nr:type II toxin-antitoxin system VapB family antitoxin [Tagaea sp.]